MKILRALLVVALTAPSAAALASDQEGLKLELTPYAWAAGVDGAISAGQQTAHFNKSFSDLVDNVDGAFMVLGVVSYNRFVFYADYDYMSLSGETNRLPNGDRIRGDLDLDVTTFSGGYRFDTFGKDNTIDVLFGSRKLSLDTNIRHTGITNLRVSGDWDVTDTIVMLRPSFQISERWRFNPTVAYGISGDSDTTYELSPQVQWDFSDAFALRFGYKKLHYRQENGQKNTPTFREFDGDIEGMMLGVGWTLPTR